MSLEKIIFLRDKSLESIRISKLLDENKIKYTEIYSNSQLIPGLIIQESIYSIKGYKNILNKIEYLKNLNNSKD
mgnify:CR=1 FL=1